MHFSPLIHLLQTALLKLYIFLNSVYYPAKLLTATQECWDSVCANLMMHRDALQCRMNGRSQTVFVEMWKTREADTLGSTEDTVSLINIYHAQSGSSSSIPNLHCKCKAAFPHSLPQPCFLTGVNGNRAPCHCDAMYWEDLQLQSSEHVMFTQQYLNNMSMWFATAEVRWFGNHGEVYISLKGKHANEHKAGIKTISSLDWPVCT